MAAKPKKEEPEDSEEDEKEDSSDFDDDLPEGVEVLEEDEDDVLLSENELEEKGKSKEIKAAKKPEVKAPKGKKEKAIKKESEDEEFDEEEEKILDKEEMSEEESEEDKEQEPEKEKKVHKEEGEKKDDVELFIGNLPFTASQESAQEFFAKYGDIASIKLLQRVFYCHNIFIEWQTIWERIRPI